MRGAIFREPYSMTNLDVLVTGAYGFVGRHVTRALAARGYHVTGIGHGAWDRKEWRAWGIDTWHLADITIESLVTYGGDPEIIFHCAGSGSVAFSIKNPYQDFHRTVSTTHAVLEYIRTARPSAALVLPSSAGVYGAAQSMPIEVDSPLNPVSPYGVHKKIAEELCLCYGRHYGVRAAIVRLFSIYGIGLRKQLLWDACVKLSAQESVFAGTGLETRDWLHIEDAAALMVHAAKHVGTSCPIANGGAGEATTIATIIGVIAEELGGLGPPQFSGVSRLGDPTHYQANIDQARAWGWEPKRSWNLEVKDYARWFKEGAA